MNARETAPAWLVMKTWRPGSQGDDWTWADEAADLIRREPEKMAALVEDIAANGVREPVLLGNDGRVWDGHHRILAALLARTWVPITDSSAEVRCCANCATTCGGCGPHDD